MPTAFVKEIGYVPTIMSYSSVNKGVKCSARLTIELASATKWAVARDESSLRFRFAALLVDCCVSPCSSRSSLKDGVLSRKAMDDVFE
jgi:hypothetical protein